MGPGENLVYFWWIFYTDTDWQCWARLVNRHNPWIVLRVSLIHQTRNHSCMVAHSMDSPNAQESLSCAFGEFNYLILFMFLQPESAAHRYVYI